MRTSEKFRGVENDQKKSICQYTGGLFLTHLFHQELRISDCLSGVGLFTPVHSVQRSLGKAAVQTTICQVYIG